MRKLILFLILGMFLVSSISALEFDNIEKDISIVKDLPITLGLETIDYKVIWEKYQPIEIENWFGLGEILWSGAINEHDEFCGSSCQSTIDIYLSKEGSLIDEIKFYKILDERRLEKIIEEYSIYIKTGEEDYSVNDYDIQCEKNNGITGKCTNVLIGTHIETRELWEEYVLGNKLPVGNYKVKLEAKKDSKETIDWVIKSQGEWLDSWAAWYGIAPSAYYKMENNGLDSSGNGADLTLNGANSFNPVAKLGSYSRKYTTDVQRGDSTSDYIGNFGTGVFTIAYWVKTTDLSGETAIIANDPGIWGSPTSVNTWTANLVHTTNEVRFTNGATTAKITSITGIADGLWHRVVFVREGTGANQFKVYLDGNNEANATNADNYTGGTLLTLGGIVDVTAGFVGLLEEVVIFNTTAWSQSDVDTDWNSGAGNEIDQNNTVTLNSPSNLFTSSSEIVEFNCSSTATVGVTNISLWSDLSGTWEIINVTTGLSGTTNTSIWLNTISPDGTYLWSCQGCNDDDECTFFNNNRTLTIDTSAPTITINNPTGTMDYGYIGGSETLNWNVSDANLDSIWYDYNGTNFTVYGAVNTTTFILEDNFNLTLYTNDTGNNLNSNFTSWDYKLFFINETYVSSTTAGSTVDFAANFRTNGTRIGTIYLNYNNTNNIASLVNTGNEYSTSISKLVPGVETLTNISFYWNVTLEDSSSQSTASNNQTVSPIVINDTCSADMNFIYNLTLVDEVSQGIINGAVLNGSIKIDFNLYTSDRNTLLKQYHTEKSNVNSAAICIDSNLSSGEEYSMDLQIQYGATNYSSEFYNLEDETLNNKTLSQNITLYDLDDANTQEFKLNVRDKSFVPISSALIKIERKYIENGTFYITEIPKSDTSGVASASLQVNNVIYNFYIYSNGEIISSFTNVLAICQNPTLRECEIDFNSYLEGLTIIDYATADDFNYTLDYNSTSRVITSDFLIPSGDAAVVKLEVIREDTLGTAVCSDTLTSTGGSLSCIVPGQFGNATIRARLYKDNVVVGWGNFNLDQKSSDIYGVILIFISVLVMMTLIGVSISDNPVVTGIFLFVGLILIFSMNLVQNKGFYGATASILFFAIAMILVIIKAARRN